MVRLVSGAVLSLLIWLLTPTEAPPQSNLSLIGGRTRREVNCRDQQEYRSGGICCLTCPAGTYLTSPCRTSGQQGVCQECDDGTYMEHTNGLSQCFRCTQCRPDQEVLKQCAHTHNTECRCRPGRFCDPDQACELCKRCSRCGQDEETVRNCTPTANTECKKVRSSSAPPTVGVSVIVLLSLAAVAVIIFVVIFVCIWKRRKRAASQNLSEEQKTGQPFQALHDEGGGRGPHRPSIINTRHLVRTNSFKHTTEERKVLCESLNSSASNSQYSLTGLTSCSSPASPPVANPAAPPQPLWREDEQFPRLVAVNGEESLRNCFEYFEELNMDYHKKFFRHLGISDNTIKAKEGLPYEDRIHALLNVWIEKAGSEASLNDLLQVLLNLGQCRTAEVIKEKAVHHRHYRCEG